MKVGIAGIPKPGKSSLFSALAGAAAEAEKRPPRAATAQQTPNVNCPVELRRTATIALAGNSRRSRYRFLGRDGTGGENVALEVAVVPLGRADVGVGHAEPGKNGTDLDSTKTV